MARLTIFEKAEDYAAFMRVVDETRLIGSTTDLCHGSNAQSLAFFVVRPETSDQVREFFRRLTVMHHDALACSL